MRSCLPWDTPQNDHDSADARGPGARDHAFPTAFPEPVDPHGEHLRPPHEGAPDELWIEDPNSPKVLDQYAVRVANKHYTILLLVINNQISLHFFWFPDFLHFTFRSVQIFFHSAIWLLSCKYEPLTQGIRFNPNHDGSSQLQLPTLTQPTSAKTTTHHSTTDIKQQTCNKTTQPATTHPTTPPFSAGTGPRRLNWHAVCKGVPARFT